MLWPQNSKSGPYLATLCRTLTMIAIVRYEYMFTHDNFMLVQYLVFVAGILAGVSVDSAWVLTCVPIGMLCLTWWVSSRQQQEDVPPVLTSSSAFAQHQADDSQQYHDSASGVGLRSQHAALLP